MTELKPEPGAEAPPPPEPSSGLRTHLPPLLLAVPILTVLTGVLYPLLLAASARPLFPHQADGNLVERDGTVVGSECVGQDFSRPSYFHPRPSAAGDGYDGAASGGTNLGPNSTKLRDEVRELAVEYRRRNALAPDTPVPADAVTRSGSGLDPHISCANAALQIPRVARERRLDEDVVRGLVAAHTRGRQLGFLGEPRVEVLALNLSLDRGDVPPPVATHHSATTPRGRWLEYAAFLLVILLLARPVGGYLARVFEGKPTFPDRFLRPVECPPSGKCVRWKG